MACDNLFGSPTFVTTSVEERWHHTTLLRFERVVSDESTCETHISHCVQYVHTCLGSLKNLVFN